MPKISVIVPVYKVEQYLNRCIDSILNQTHKDFELVLVDDGSPDNCGKICDEYAKKDSRIHVIHKKNGGLSDARNFGIDYAFLTDSEYITFIDSDDYVSEKYLEVLLNLLVEYKVEISSCSFMQFSGEICEAVNKESQVFCDTAENLGKEFKLNLSIACARLYKKQLFNKIRFPFGKLFEDERTTYKLLFGCEKVVSTTERLYYYFINPNGIMNTDWKLEKRLDQMHAFLEKLDFFIDGNFTATAISYLGYYVMRLKPCIKEYGKKNRLIKDELKLLKEFLISHKNVDIINEAFFVWKIVYPVRTFFRHGIWYLKNRGLKNVIKKLFSKKTTS